MASLSNDDSQGLDWDDIYNMSFEDGLAIMDGEARTSSTGDSGATSGNLLDLFEEVCQDCGSMSMVLDITSNCYVCEFCGTATDFIPSDLPEYNQDDVPRIVPLVGTRVRGGGKIGLMHNWEQVSYKQRAMQAICSMIEMSAAKCKIIKPVIDSAKIFYQIIRESKHVFGPNEGKPVLHRGRKLKQLISSCLYFGAIRNNYPMTLDSVGKVFGLSCKDVTAGCRMYLNMINDNCIVYKLKQLNAIEHIVSKDFEESIASLACKVATNIYKLNLATNHQPTTIAAVSIYIATGMGPEVDRRTIITQFNISMVTLNQMIREVVKYVKIITNDVKTDYVCNKLQQKQMLLETDTTPIILPKQMSKC